MVDLVTDGGARIINCPEKPMDQKWLEPYLIVVLGGIFREKEDISGLIVYLIIIILAIVFGLTVCNNMLMIVLSVQAFHIFYTL